MSTVNYAGSSFDYRRLAHKWDCSCVGSRLVWFYELCST